ncbi:hypothetical protein BHC49_06425 [Snodgrassella alvi]|uniref:Siphovirus Gp157 family protein n=1 Tax=Snodgrassella alvi TaxID=1196083 RepID=A0A2N9XYA4_9NEIS|nr:hypothetical protein BGI34_01290 [Snodgrassella alvi]PIT55407.1 hypothetical protein BHC49_06425 [Snodgrassella alvi]
MKLYQCADDVVRLLNAMDNDADISPDTIAMVIEDFQSKALDIGGYVLNLSAQREMISSHIKDMQAKLKRFDNKIENITKYVEIQMRRSDIKKINSFDGTFSMGFRKTRPKVEIFDESLIPDEYFRVKTVKEVNKISLQEALASGVDVQGAKLIQTETLRIK